MAATRGGEHVNALVGILLGSLLGALLWLALGVACRQLTAQPKTREVYEELQVTPRGSGGPAGSPPFAVASFDARALPVVGPPAGSEGPHALRSSSRMRDEASTMLYEAADLADAFRRLGSTCRTPAAVRARVRSRDMSPDDHTPRGVALWTSDGVGRELLREARLLLFGDTSRRPHRREPVQLEFRA
jgi:hypothetical protein